VLYGGDGTDPYTASVPGAAGLWLDDSSVSAQGSTVHGGYGDTASGGSGLVALNGSSLRLLQSSVVGGGGAPVGDAQSVDGSSAVLELSGAAHSLPSVSPVREGELYALTVQGAPGDSVWLALSVSPGWLPADNGDFVLTVGSPLYLIPLGTLGPGGVGSLSLSVPRLGPGLEAVDVMMQDLYVEAGGGPKVLGPTTVITLLDASY
jgi:hypothetical protein